MPQLVRKYEALCNLIQVLREIDDMIALMILVEPVEVDEMAVDQYDIECTYDGKRLV